MFLYLGGFVPALNEFVNAEYGCSFTVDDYFSYEFFEVWRISKELCQDRVHAFFESSHFLTGIEVLAGAVEILEKYQTHFSYHLVTSRQLSIQEATESWLTNYYPGVFDTVHFGNHYGMYNVGS